MKTHTQTTWTSTVKLGAVISIIAAVLGSVLVSVSDVPQAVVVIGVMVVGFAASMATSAHTSLPRPQPHPVPVVRDHRHAA